MVAPSSSLRGKSRRNPVGQPKNRAICRRNPADLLFESPDAIHFRWQWDLEYQPQSLPG
jgi:hypothetical protein